MALAGVGQHFSRNFDQYTIICVFGSVVGCVVLPLMAQSLESLIITAILFGVTVKTLNKKQVVATGVPREAQEERKKEKKGKKGLLKRHPPVQQGVVDMETVRAQRELELIKREELRLQEKELKTEEKRKKKAKKREEKLLKREEERVEKEKLEAALLEQKKERTASKKRCKPADLPSMNMLNSVIYDSKVSRRERKNSNSSSNSSMSSYSAPPLPRPPKRRPPPRTPKRASSAPLFGVTPPAERPRVMQGPAASTPSSASPMHANHQVQVFPLLLPLMAPPMTHPHFVYGPVPQLPAMMQSGHDHSAQPHPLSAQPHPYPYNWNGHQVMQSPLQPVWASQAVHHQMSTTDHVIRGSDRETSATGHVVASVDHVINPNGVTSVDHVPTAADHVTTNNGHGNTWHVASDSETGNDYGLAEVGSAPLTTPPGIEGRGPAQGFYSLLNDMELTSDPATPSCGIWTPPSCDEGCVQWPDIVPNTSSPTQ